MNALHLNEYFHPYSHVERLFHIIPVTKMILRYCFAACSAELIQGRSYADVGMVGSWGCEVKWKRMCCAVIDLLSEMLHVCTYIGRLTTRSLNTVYCICRFSNAVHSSVLNTGDLLLPREWWSMSFFLNIEMKSLYCLGVRLSRN